MVYGLEQAREWIERDGQRKIHLHSSIILTVQRCDWLMNCKYVS